MLDQPLKLNHSYMMDRRRIELNRPYQQLSGVEESLPYIVLVISIIDMSRGGRQYQQYGCSGTLVRPHLVLTTAACLFVKDQGPPDFRDTMVISRITGIQYKAKWLYIHPEFKHSLDYNIAVIEIETLDEDIALPILPTSLLTFRDVKDSCVLGGYGSLQLLSTNSFKSVQLKDTGLKELQCRKTHKDFMVCVHFLDLQPCEGDMGAPLICDGELFAIFTPKYMIKPLVCMDRYGAMFTPVYPFYDEWLERIIEVDYHNKMEWMNNPLNILFLSGVVLAIIGVIYYLIIGWISRSSRPIGSDRFSSVTEASSDRPRTSSLSADRVRWM